MSEYNPFEWLLLLALLLVWIKLRQIRYDVHFNHEHIRETKLHVLQNANDLKAIKEKLYIN